MLLGVFNPLADRFRDFAGFTQADADFALLVADDDERAEREPATAFDDLGDTVYIYDFLLIFRSFVVPSSPSVTSFSS